MSRRSICGFTVLELLIVISIIIVLAALTLATMGYVQKKGARSRTETEIAAISAALENYKADNGVYPRDAASTDTLDARTDGTTGASYQKASQYLYGQLGADPDFDGGADPNFKSYFTFKAQMLSGQSSNGQFTQVNYIRDPFGNSYGYSTAHQTDAAKGYNPTFDLWSTGGLTSGTDQSQWIKNW